MRSTLTYLETDGEHVMSDEAAASVGDWLPNVIDGSHVAMASPHLDGVDTRAGFHEGLWEFL